MGPRNSKQNQVNFMRDYDVIQSIPSDNLTYLQHKTSKEEYLLREFNFNDKRECEKTMEKLADLKNKLAGNKHVVALKDYIMSAEDQYCSTFYKIYALFQYPQRTLDDEISERKLLRRKFEERDLWSILASCIVGLSHLQKNGIKHSSLKSSNILLSTQGVIKISDPFATGQLNNYDAALTKRSTQHAYLSPQQTSALQQELVSPTYNAYKSDIWALGMIMLEAGLFEYQDEECYRDEKSRIHWETVQYNVERLGKAYSDEIKNMVEFMLSRDERARPDWTDLEEHVMKGNEQARRSNIQDQSKIENSSFVPGDIHFSTSQRPQTRSQLPLSSNTIHTHNQPARNTLDALYNQQVSPRVHIVPQVPTNQNIGSSTFVPYQRPESPRISHQVPSGPVFSTLANSTFNPNLNLPVSSIPTQGGYRMMGQPVGSMGGAFVQQHQAPNIAPLRPSLIQATRPMRNIFPSDSYITRTKLDENLIVMVQDEEEEGNFAEEKDNMLKYLPMQPQPQPVHYQRYPQTNQFRVQTQRQSSYSSPGQTQLRNVMPSAPRPVASTNYEPMPRPSPQGGNQPAFVVQQFKMGSRYEGYKLQGLRHGYGKFFYQDGGMYDGDWRHNKMEGYGKLYYQSGKPAYEGEWRNDQFMGQGVLFNEAPDVLTRPFNYENLDDIEEYWTKYQGQFADDMKNGRGTLYLSNGQRFQGNFAQDIAQGPGVFHCKNGNKVQGVWSSNRLISA